MPRGGRQVGSLPTMRDVAERAMVSPMTVSRVLQDDPRVATPTRARVLAAVDELGYRRNAAARSLRLGRGTGLVGLIVTNLANPFYAQLALGVESVIGEHGLRAVLCNTGEDVRRERLMVADLAAHRVDGMIVVPSGGDQSHLDPARLKRLPVVLAARPPSGPELDCVLVDDFAGARQATSRLVAAGHRGIGFLGLSPSVWNGAERFRGFCTALDEAAIPFQERYLRLHQPDIAAAERAARELLELPEPPTALFSANNRNTIGAFRAISATGSPTALAGFDHFELADMLGWPLTVVAYDPAEVGRQAARLLLARLTGSGADGASPSRIIVPTTIVEYGQAAAGSVRR